MAKERKKQTIGRREIIDLPELDLMAVEAKTDTGAYTSALHVSRVVLKETDGKTFVAFSIVHHSRPKSPRKMYKLELLGQRKVKNSFGITEIRYLVKTRLRAFGRSYKVEFTLADRSRMETPVLLGRKFLRGRFVVDVARKNLSLAKKNGISTKKNTSNK